MTAQAEEEPVDPTPVVLKGEIDEDQYNEYLYSTAGPKNKAMVFEPNYDDY